mmetsp:Transcript_13082/g.21357  ORF Transcript_13082/g.21357 Transcript_13082/m.21357 type:complete len:481 (-) Transcript_13082:288-1730(-)
MAPSPTMVPAFSGTRWGVRSALILAAVLGLQARQVNQIGVVGSQQRGPVEAAIGWNQHLVSGGRSGKCGVQITPRLGRKSIQRNLVTKTAVAVPFGEGKNAAGRRRRMDETMFYFEEDPQEKRQPRRWWRRRRGQPKTKPEDVIIRTRRGRELPIPQTLRYYSSDWLRILAEMRESMILNRIFIIVASNVAWAAAVVLFHKFVWAIPTEPSTGPGMLKSALGYLLVFRTNSAYNRFWEGRKIWQEVVDKSRQLARYMVLYEQEIGTERARQVIRLVRAYCLTLKQHLTSYDATETKYIEEELLTKEEAESLRSWKRARPLFIAGRLEMLLQHSPFEGIFRGEDRLTVVGVARDIGGTLASCERIVQTPIPLNYARHTSRFLTLWIMLLPVTMVGDLGWLALPVTAFVTWAFFAIQEIGLVIEEPFSVNYLPLNVFCRSIFEDTETELALLGGDEGGDNATAHDGVHPHRNFPSTAMPPFF